MHVHVHTYMQGFIQGGGGAGGRGGIHLPSHNLIPPGILFAPLHIYTVNPERIASVIFNDFINPATLTSLYDNDFSRVLHAHAHNVAH